jgi:hypothetical protein
MLLNRFVGVLMQRFNVLMVIATFDRLTIPDVLQQK